MTLATLAAVTLTLTAPVSSDSATVGQDVPITASDDSTARAIVSHVSPRRNRGRDGSITITVITPCVTSATVTGRSGTLANLAAIGATGFLVKGKHAVAPAGMTLQCPDA